MLDRQDKYSSPTKRNLSSLQEQASKESKNDTSQYSPKKINKMTIHTYNLECYNPQTKLEKFRTQYESPRNQSPQKSPRKDLKSDSDLSKAEGSLLSERKKAMQDKITQLETFEVMLKEKEEVMKSSYKLAVLEEKKLAEKTAQIEKDAAYTQKYNYDLDQTEKLVRKKQKMMIKINDKLIQEEAFLEDKENKIKMRNDSLIAKLQKLNDTEKLVKIMEENFKEAEIKELQYKQIEEKYIESKQFEEEMSIKLEKNLEEIKLKTEESKQKLEEIDQINKSYLEAKEMESEIEEIYARIMKKGDELQEYQTLIKSHSSEVHEIGEQNDLEIDDVQVELPTNQLKDNAKNFVEWFITLTLIFMMTYSYNQGSTF